MKFKIVDLVVLAIAVLGIIGSINWIEIPFWLYLLLIVAYAGLRLSKKESDNVSDFDTNRTVGGELPPDDDEEGGAV